MSPKLLVFLALVAVGSLIAVAAAFRDHGFESERELELNMDDNKIEIESKAKFNDTDKSRFDFEFTTDGFPRFRIKAFNKSDDLVSGFSFRAGFLEIFEYQETPGSPIGWDANDTIVSRFSFSGRRNLWSNLKNSHTVQQVNGVPIHHLNTTLTAPNGQTKFTFLIHIAGDTVQDTQGRHLSSSAFKFDFKVENYPYASNNSRLGITAFVDSSSTRRDRDYDHDDDNDHNDGDDNDDAQEMKNRGINASIDIGNAGFFGWESNATADGQTVPVIATILRNVAKSGDTDDDDDRPDESRDVIVFSLPVDNPSVVYWDPQVGVKEASTTTNTSASSSSASSFAAGITVLMMTLIASMAALFF